MAAAAVTEVDYAKIYLDILKTQSSIDTTTGKPYISKILDSYKNKISKNNYSVSGEDMLRLLNIIPFISPDEKSIICERKDLLKDEIFPIHDDTIQLVIKVMPDGMGDFAHIKNYIRIFNMCGYKNENITIIICLGRYLCPTYNENKMFFGFVKTIKTLQEEHAEFNVKVDGTLPEIEEFTVAFDNLYEIKDASDRFRPRYIDITEFLEYYEPNKYNKIFQKMMFNEKEYSYQDFAKHIFLSRSKIDYNILDTLLEFKDISASIGFRKNFMFLLNATKNMAYLKGITYLMVQHCDSFYYNIDVAGDKCNIDLLEEIPIVSRNNMIITFNDYPPKYAFVDKTCRNIVDTSEGGYRYSTILRNEEGEITKGTKFNSGIGFPFIGLYHGVLHNVRPVATKQYICSILNTMFYNGISTITNYYMAYVGQIDIENKRDKQLLKFSFYVAFISFISKIDTHIIAPYALVNYIDNIMQNIGNIIEITSIRRDEQKIMLITNGINITILFYKAFKNNINLINVNEATFQEVMKCSEEPVATTGDLSYQESLVLGKISLHDCISWKIPMVKMFIDTLKHYYKLMGIESELPDFYNSIASLFISIETDNEEGDESDIGENPMSVIIGKIKTINFENEIIKYKSFVENFLNVYCNADHNMCMIIYLHRMNLINRETILKINLSNLEKSKAFAHSGGYYNIYNHHKKMYLLLR